MTRDEAILAGVDSLQQSQKDALGAAFDAGLQAAPVVPSTPVPVDVQAQIDQAVADKTADLQKHLDEKQAELDKALSDDASDKSQIEAQKTLIDGIKALLMPKVEAPVEASPTAQP